MAAPLRIGVLGAARIAPAALVRPARELPEAELAAVAARDPARARRFAAKHGVPTVHESYDALLADESLDAVYNPLPNSLHCEWTVRALRAGLHVLCEKPMASNADEAARMAEVADETGRVLMEAFHWRYHPLAARLLEILASGEIGKVQHVEAHLCAPLLIPGDIRYRLDLAGGAMMDTGCYTVSMIRHLAGAEPEVMSAKARLSSEQVDRRMEAELRFGDGRTGRLLCALASIRLLDVSAKVRGDAGSLRVLNPVMPHAYHRLVVRGLDGKRSERVAGDATYTCQLRAFVDAVRNGTRVPTDARDAIANMRVVDDVYRAAGLRVRGAT